MARPPVKPKRPLQPFKILEGAAVLQEIANNLKDTLDTSAGKNIDFLKVPRTQIVKLEFVTRLTAHTVDDLVWVIEKQEMEVKFLRALLQTLQEKNS